MHEATTEAGSVNFEDRAQDSEGGKTRTSKQAGLGGDNENQKSRHSERNHNQTKRGHGETRRATRWIRDLSMVPSAVPTHGLTPAALEMPNRRQDNCTPFSRGALEPSSLQALGEIRLKGEPGGTGHDGSTSKKATS
ncbi:hypothetical protein B0H10DRAFT_2371981 [Mycena sp. CBHHK59/15]|nr:hypothetical protein B0H10DRAFT_2371981 [Mycena sp. CBHHK59/15]